MAAPTARLLGSLVRYRPLAAVLGQNGVRTVSTATAARVKVTGKESSATFVDQVAEKTSDKEDFPEWKSFGYNYEDPVEDVKEMRMTMCVMIGAMVFGAFYFKYRPDMRNDKWPVREAQLQMAEREAQGLFYINHNYADPDNIILPEDETPYVDERDAIPLQGIDGVEDKPVHWMFEMQKRK